MSAISPKNMSAITVPTSLPTNNHEVKSDKKTQDQALKVIKSLTSLTLSPKKEDIKSQRQEELSQKKICRPDGTLLYYGLCKENIFHEGTLFYTDGITPRYKGSFRKGKFHGLGKVFRSNGTIEFDGNFVEGLPDGFGQQFFPDGGTIEYKGFYQKGRPHGHGIMYFPNGNPSLEGHFNKGTLEGKGKSYYESGNIEYIGSFLKGKGHGYGKCYRNNERNTLKYEGFFYQDKLHGQIKVYLQDGRTIKCISDYDMDVCQSSLAENVANEEKNHPQPSPLADQDS